DSYKIEISTNKEFTEQLRSLESREPLVFLEDLEQGEYFWRIAPHFTMGDLQWLPFGEISSFKLQQNLSLSDTILIYPTMDDRIPNFESSAELRFSWTSDRDGTSFNLKVSRNSDMSFPFIDESLSQNYFYTQLAQSGNYYWQVTGLSFDNLELPISEIGEVKIVELDDNLTLLSPAPGTQFEKGLPVLQELQWESIEEGLFRLQVWHNKQNALEGELIHDNLTASRKSMVSITEGGFYTWQVSWVDPQGNPLDQSEIRSFQIEPPFLGPEIISPAPEAELVLIGTPQLPLAWSTPQGDRVDVSIINRDSGTVVYENKDITTKELVLNDFTKFSTGNYRITIQTQRDNPPQGYTSRSQISQRDFTIEQLKIYTAPVIQLPRDNQEISYLEVLKNGGISLQWTHQTSMNRYEINLYPSESAQLPIGSFETLGKTFFLEDIEPGEYYVEVQGFDLAGYSSPLSNRIKFIISALGNLDRPRLLKPTPGSTVDMTDLNTLDLQWTSVEEAEYYKISLYNSQGGLVLQENRFTNNQLRIDDLSLLSVGKFSIEITAEIFYRDIGLTRSSLPYTSDFNISLNQDFSAPEIITDDIQFTD
nr:hypothetical protein [Spirochaetaceae bacterium]